jgi:hypothetical protein
VSVASRAHAAGQRPDPGLGVTERIVHFRGSKWHPVVPDAPGYKHFRSASWLGRGQQSCGVEFPAGVHCAGASPSSNGYLVQQGRRLDAMVCTQIAANDEHLACGKGRSGMVLAGRNHCAGKTPCEWPGGETECRPEHADQAKSKGC